MPRVDKMGRIIRSPTPTVDKMGRNRSESVSGSEHRGNMSANLSSTLRVHSVCGTWVSQTPEEAADEAREIEERMDLESQGKGGKSLVPGALYVRGVIGVSLLAQIIVLVSSLAITYLGPPPVAESWLWVGGVTSTGFEARVRGGGGKEFEVSGSQDFAARVFQVMLNDTDGVAAVRVVGLEPSSEYWYRVAGLPVGRLRTWPTNGTDPRTHRIAFASCASTGSNHPVFSEIAAGGYDLFISTGDLHYRDLTEGSGADFDKAYGYVHGSAAQRELWQAVPVSYMWDDHDFGGNNKDSTVPSSQAALDAYRRNVPHPPLASGSVVYHAFTMGRVRIIVPDLRSEMLIGGRMFSEDQKTWLSNEIARAGDYSLVVILLMTPWIGPALHRDDGWLGHTSARKWLSSQIAATRRRGGALGGYANIVGISGDAHMAAYDDGTHSDYSGTGDAGFPLIQAAPLDRFGKAKGGPYSTPCFGYLGKRVHQYGTLTVHDEGGSEPSAVCIEVQLRAEGEGIKWESGRKC
eukprot:Hpha_TRINITY_DN23681_c0_g1::TRINITY_DN23681_c0_g1_i1::g.57487::m.57487/K01113/phoD; alkaline phosphatase D